MKRSTLSFLVVAMVMAHTHGQSLKQQTCNRPMGHAAIIQPDADAFIAGFFPMHNSGKNGVGCGDISTFAFQSYESIRWALDRLNKKDEVLNGEQLNDYYIPGIKIGMIAQDYCDNSANSVSIAQDLFPQLNAGATECSAVDGLMLGLISGGSSDDAKDMEKFAETHNLPLVSYTATAPELSDTQMFTNFMRTIPPDGPLTQTIADFIKLNEIGWEYVVIVYTDNSYGRGAYKSIRPQLVDSEICLTAAIPVDPNDDSDAAIEDILRQIYMTKTVGVIYLGNGRIIKALLNKGENDLEAGKLQWVVTDSISVAETFPGQLYPRGLISVLPLGRKIIEFEDHWVRIDPNNPSSENPWYKAAYMASNMCNLPGMTSQYPNDCDIPTETSRRNSFVQDQFVEPAVHAVFVYARALKQAHEDMCGGAPGMCTALRQLSTTAFYNNYMRNIDFVYGKAERVESLASYTLDPYNTAAHVRFNGNDLTNPAFAIYNFNNYRYGTSYLFQSVGTNINNRLEVISTRLRFYNDPRTQAIDTVPRSVCPSSPCASCLGYITEPKYVYIPGDLVINAVFSIHESGMHPLSCGDFVNSPEQGIQFMQAFIYAVNYVNSQFAPSLRGLKIGALGFDDCMSPFLSNQLLTEVERYSRKIVDANGENMLDPRKIQAYMGGREPWAALSMGWLMNTFKKPMMGIETWTQMINDEEIYPYFLRSHYDIEYVARAIVNVAKRNGWKYMQSVHHGDMFGKESNDVLRKVAAEEGICIVASYEIEMGAEHVVKSLRSRPDVKPVVLLMFSHGFRMFMQGVNDTNSGGTMQFISVFGDSKKTVQGYEHLVHGMVSLELWSTGQLTNFQGNHLRQINAETYMVNPWMREWYENFYACSFTPEMGERQCTGQNMFEDQANFELNSNVISVIYGVRAIALGLIDTLDYYCGQNTVGICGDFINAKDQSMVLMDMISKVTFSEGGNKFEFRGESRKMGNIPFSYYNYLYNSVTKIGDFSSVGEYKPSEDYLYLEGYTLISDVTSQCPGVCMECLYMFRYQKYLYVDGDILIPGIFDVHYKGDSPYSCSNIRRENGFQYTEAFRFALESINNKQGNVTLNGVRLGGIGFDGCTDPIRASAIVTGIYSGAFPKPKTDLGEIDLDMGSLMGWLGYDSESTISMSRILQRFGIPIVSPGATSPVLDDKSEFTSFFRTIPSNSVVAKAMALLSRRLGFDYIITLNAPEDGSRDGVKMFRQYAEEQGICIGASYEFETDGDVDQIMAYILQSTTKVVAVFAPPDSNIAALIDKKSSTAAAQDLIFIANNPWTIPVQGRQAPVATINFMADGPYDLASFRLYLESQIPSMNHPNPWLREFYESVYQCNLAGTYKYDSLCLDPRTKPIAQDQIMQDIRVIPTMNAVYALAEGIHRTLKQKCGENYNGICASFISDTDTYDVIMEKMDELQFQDVTDMMFRFIEREADRKLVFKRLQADGSENLEGSFQNGQLQIRLEETLKTIYEDIPAQCIGQCMQCQQESLGLEEFMYIAGEIHIGALFDIHEMGSTPFTCGQINGIHGFQLMEAFNWAMDYVNTKQGMFQGRLAGVKLGSLVFDTCKSPVRAGNLIANYHARNFEIRTDIYRIDPSLIDLYIGPMTSEASIRVADVLAELGIPQIGYGASSLELRNRRKYRYFIRTVPADDKQSRALISFLKKYELQNVQLVSQFSSVGEFGRDEFMRLAPLNHICVSQEFVIGQDGPVTEEEARNVVMQLNNKPDAKTVVVIMDNPYILLKVANSYPDIASKFSFIGTDKWGFGIAGFEGLVGLDNLIRNKKVVTLDVETADFPELDLYLENKVPANYSRNPWFKDYYEHAHNCSMSQPPVGYAMSCSQYHMGYSRSENYIQDPYALYVINAVFSAALGIDETLVQWCGGRQYYGVCNILRTHGEKRDLILENIKKVNFIDQTDQPFYYTADGESDRGFHLYQPQSNQMSLHGLTEPSGYYWDDIGSYNDTHYLKMWVGYDPEWVSNCEKPGSCQCVFPAYQPSRYMSIPSPQDLNLVYVSNIHKPDPTGGFGCGAINTGSDFQNLLAFIYAINLVNENANSKYPGSLKLGGVALDTCSQPNRIGQDVYSLLSGEAICGADSGQVVKPSSVLAYLVKDSQNSIALSSMLSPVKVTSVSMSATSVELSDKFQHAYFLRTVPPDNVQALVVVQILQRFGWDYASVVYADNSYGRSAVQTLLGQIDRRNPILCFGRSISMPLDTDLDGAKEVINQLNSQIGSRVVVTFVTSSQVRLLMQAATEKGLNSRFIWIGSDTWADNTQLTEDYEETATGAVTIQIRSEYSQGFKDFFMSLNFTNRQGIPDDWFEELYQTFHECRILNSVVPKTFTRICNEDETFTESMFQQDPFVLHTMISVFQVANGLADLENCKRTGLTVSSCLSLQTNRRQVIYDSILSAQQSVLPEDLGNNSFSFKFTGEGYGDIGYNIYNFRRNPATSQYEYIKIGSSSGELQVNTRLYQGHSFTDRSLPLSRCPIGSTCRCIDNTDQPFSYSRQDSGYVITDEGQYVDPTTGQLVTIEDTPELTDRFRDIWALIVATLAALGAFAALCMFIYLLVVYPVRGGTTILGYMLSFGIIILYALVFAFIVHASEEVCAIRRFCLGFVYSICYSALFVKLVDCWRTKNKEDIYMVKYNKIGNPWGLFFSAVLLVLVQVMINAEWLILEAPEMTRVIYNNKLWPRCTPDDFYDEGLVLSNVYVMFLIFLSIIVGLGAFGNDKNHWDCRWLLGCVVLTIPAWMVWCLVACLGEYKMRDAAAAIGLLYNATVMLLCGPLRKLYLLNKYQARLEEEERKSQLAGRDYNSMYSRQYDNMPHMQDGDSLRGSSVGNDDVFMHEPKR